MNKYGLTLVSGPAVEPVTVLEAKSHLRVEYDAEDSLIASLIAAARELVENTLNRAIYTQTWKMTLDSFPDQCDYATVAPNQRDFYSKQLDRYSIYIPLGGVKEITSITYTDTEIITIDPNWYRVDVNAQPARVNPADGCTWPPLSFVAPGCIAITLTAGSYGDGSEIDVCPLSIKQAILLLIGHLYANREAATDKSLTTLPFAVDALLATYKVIATC